MIIDLIGKSCPEDFAHVSDMTKIQKQIAAMSPDELDTVIEQCTDQSESATKLKKLVGCVINPNITGVQLDSIWRFISCECPPIKWALKNKATAATNMVQNNYILSELAAHPNLSDKLVQVFADKLLKDDYYYFNYFNFRNSVVLNPLLPVTVMQKFFDRHTKHIGGKDYALSHTKAKTIFLHFYHAPSQLLEKWFDVLLDRSGYTNYFWFIPSILSKNEKCSAAFCARMAEWSIEFCKTTHEIPEEFLISVKRLSDHKNMPTENGSFLKQEMYRLTSDAIFLPKDVTELFMF